MAAGTHNEIYQLATAAQLYEQSHLKWLAVSK